MILHPAGIYYSILLFDYTTQTQNQTNSKLLEKRIILGPLKVQSAIAIPEHPHLLTLILHSSLLPFSS